MLLDGEGTGPARNVVVVSEVQPAYAPAGSALVAAAVPGHEALRPGLTSPCVNSWPVGSRHRTTTCSTWVPTSLPMANPSKARPSTRPSASTWAKGCTGAATIATRPRSRARCSAASARLRPCCATCAGPHDAAVWGKGNARDGPAIAREVPPPGAGGGSEHSRCWCRHGRPYRGRALSGSGHGVTVFDEGCRPGGRLATTALGGEARADYGAQFFTARNDAFKAVVTGWVAEGTVWKWCRGSQGRPRALTRRATGWPSLGAGWLPGST